MILDIGRNIWSNVFGSTPGGWKTHGPNQMLGPGAFDSGGELYPSITDQLSLRLAAVQACMSIRAETIGTLPLALRDQNKKVLRDHDLYELMRFWPNAYQSDSEFRSYGIACYDMHGNSVTHITRRRDKSIVSLEPIDPTEARKEITKSGRVEWKFGGDNVPVSDDDVIHIPGFTLQTGWGLSRLDAGRHIIGAQLTANQSAQQAFKNGLKVGGFFEVEKSLDREQRRDWLEILQRHSLPENNGKYLTLLAKMKAISGKDFRISPAEAELLESRYFGIEEVCRLFNVPPQLIGHSNKASSWASSLENINLHFLMYSVTPTLVRHEHGWARKLLTREERRKGYEFKHSVEGLLRADTKTRQLFYASGLQNGYLNRNEVRDFEERGKIEHGDVYTVQANMLDIDKLTALGDQNNTTTAPPEKTP